MPEAPKPAGRFTFRPTALEGVMEVELSPVIDERGDFVRIFAAEDLAWTKLFPAGPVHVNVARTRKPGTVRGLHWQAVREGLPGEAKLITCVTGRVFDVAVDLRPGSSTFGQHHAVELDGDGSRGVLIPPGVAHGMQALEPDSRLLYLHSVGFYPQLERGAMVDDPMLAILWPLPIRNLSERDRSHPPLQGKSAE